MKKGVSDANFIPNWDTEKFLKTAKEVGFDGVELNLREEGGDITIDTPVTDTRRIVQLAREYDIEIASLTTGLLNNYPLSTSNSELRKKGIDIGLKLIEFAAEMDVEIVQMVPGVANLETSYKESYEIAAESLRWLGDEAAKAGVKIGVENVFNKFLPSPKDFSDFLDDINHPSVQAYFDNGNALVTGYPEHFIDILGDRIIAIHLKDYRIASDDFVSILEGDTNWPAMMEALNEIPYTGYLIATPQYPYTYCHERHIEKYYQDLSTVLDLVKSNQKTEN